MEKNNYSRVELEQLGAVERKARLKELEYLLSEKMIKRTTHDSFFSAIEPIIKSLREQGHDLWSWDYDGENKEIWGGDYMNPKKSGKLILEFTFGSGVRVMWENYIDR